LKGLFINRRIWGTPQRVSYTRAHYITNPNKAPWTIIEEIPQNYPTFVQGGPLLVINGVITPNKSGYNPSYPVTMPFIGVVTLLITSRGPPCIYQYLQVCTFGPL